MQRFMNIDSGNKLHSLLLQHHVNKQADGVEPVGLHDVHNPITSPLTKQGLSFVSGKPVITSPMFNSFPVAGNTPVATKQSGRIAGTFANLFARKGASE